MKDYKIYLLLIILAFLSFSCDEDDDSNEDKTGSGAKGAAKYMFIESKIYTYSLESNIDNQNTIFEKEIMTSNLELFEGKNAIFYTNDSGGERYISSENDILYGYGTFLVIDFLNKKEWLPILDLNKQDWIVYSDTIINDILKEIDVKELKGKFIKNITFNFKGKVYNGIELQYTSHSSYGYMEKNKYVKIQYKDGTETIWLVDGLGLVKSSIEKYEYFNEFEESNSTTEVILVDIKEK